VFGLPHPGVRGACLLLIVSGLFAAATAGPYVPPPLHGHVVDASGRMLAPGDVMALDRKLGAIRKQTGFAIVALVVGSLADASIEDVAYAAFNAWKIGDQGKDNGVLVVVAPVERKVHIETGKGVGGALTDLQANDIIRTTMGPLLAQGRIADAIDAGTAAIAVALMQDAPAVKPAPRRGMSAMKLGFLVGALAVGALILILSIVSPAFRTKVGPLGNALGLVGKVLVGIVSLFGGKKGGGGGSAGGGGKSGGGGSSGSY